jgi:anti-anti-sigma regulatory factor
MNLNVQIHEMSTHLSIKVVGEYSLANFCSLFGRVSEESENHAKQKVVLDVTEVSGTIPVMDLYQLGEECSRVWKSGLRIALVSLAGGFNQFFEDVAWNRGVHVSVVPNQTSAIEWVNSQH